MGRRKYQKGDTIPTLTALIATIEDGRSVFMHGKVQNAKWLMNMSVITLAGFIRSGGMAYAVEEKKSNGE